MAGNGVDNIRVNLKGAAVMGKYVVGWILGVPVLVLVIIFVLFH
jgi:hypothetical protein